MLDAPTDTKNAVSQQTQAIRFEQQHVHCVYRSIAPHFDATRRKPWPSVTHFIMQQPPGALGLDIGCGNGRHLGLRSDILLFGLDRRPNESRCDVLLRCAQTAHNTDVLIGDGLQLPLRPVFDFCLSIAVIHHFSTDARRIAALRALLHVLRPGGRAFIVVWALEQADSRRGWDAHDPQDVLVPWKTNQTTDMPLANRYYHLFRQGELEQCIRAAGGTVVASGFERDNWWAQMQRPQNEEET
ncbi:hypothetical protein PORY_002099 [Pneumocystis oryctolagi]|uniref:Uncharacterized protein n=1 Tax=Pneumocystis oryctolagi TaxID=42067 RepID=A0ACB7C9K7_9ASCO|nr:hypothetical protein PORY_002099 [Pneumocystis oryctolagi]